MIHHLYHHKDLVGPHFVQLEVSQMYSRRYVSHFELAYSWCLEMPSFTIFLI